MKPHIATALECLGVVFPDLMIAETWYGQGWAVARRGHTPGLYLVHITEVWDDTLETYRAVDMRDNVSMLGVAAFVALATERLQRATPIPNWSTDG